MVEYKAGVCNIGENEIRERYALAFMGFAISVLVIWSIILYRLPGPLLLVSFVPLVLGFEGIYQARSRFCAGYAAKGIYDAGDSKKKVTNPEDHAKDMGKARLIHAYSIISAAIIAVIAFLVD